MSGQLAPLALAPHKEVEEHFFLSVCVTEEHPLLSELTGSVLTPTWRRWLKWLVPSLLGS